MTFEIPDDDAVRRNVWLRMLLMAPTGGGKTTGALEVATNLYGGELPVVGVDTERDRMLLYATRYRFKHVPMVGDHSPEAFIDVIDSAEKKYPGGVLILDSFSHEWMGTNGILQIVDKFSDWKKARPRHTAVVERLMAAEMHVICCVRSKMDYSVEEVPDEKRGGTKQEITKIGLGPVQDSAIIYEFDVVGDINAKTHDCTLSNRCDDLVDTTRSLKPGVEVGEILTAWLSEGLPPDPPAVAATEAVEELSRALLDEGIPADKIEQGFQIARRSNRGKLHPDWVAEKLAAAQERAAARKPAAEETPTAETPAAEPVDTGESVVVPDTEPGTAWTIPQLDAYAEREGIEGWPSEAKKGEKLDAALAHYEALLAATAPSTEDETIAFGSGQEALV